MQKVLDRVGAGLSFLCAIHCCVLPMILSLLPLLGLAWFADEHIELCFLTGSALLAIISLSWGFTKHRKLHPLALASGAIGFMAVGHMIEHVPAAVLGGLGICASHIINYKLCQTCESCGGH